MALTLAILRHHGVSEVPVFAPLAVVAGGVLETLLAEAAEAIARVRVADIDVVVAHARLA